MRSDCDTSRRIDRGPGEAQGNAEQWMEDEDEGGIKWGGGGFEDRDEEQGTGG